jgi:replication fork protection complex subunit Csm3/Swi3
MGHKKRMQTMRTEWINEGKPRSSVHEESIFDEPALPPRENDERAQTAPRIAPIFETTASKRPKTPMADTEMDDIYDATPRLARTTQVEANSLFVGGNGSIFGPAKDIDDEPPGDDLDALLAEEETLQNAPEKIQVGATESRQVIPREDDFDDEMEAMAEMDGTW